MNKLLLFAALLFSIPLTAQTGTHHVLKGETIYGISRQYGIAIEALIEANPELEEGLKEGQTIRIPPSSQNGRERVEPVDTLKFDYYKVKAGETLYGLSRSWSMSIEDLEKLNPILSEGLKVDQQLKLPKGTLNRIQSTEERVPMGMRRHLVLPGETVYSIARAAGWTEEQFMLANPDVKESGLRAGAFITLPLISGTPPVNPDSAVYEILASDIIELEKEIGDGRTSPKEAESIPDTTNSGNAPSETPAGSKYEVIRIGKSDSWEDIELRYGTSRERIIELNPETANGLIPDRYLIVPVSIVDVEVPENTEDAPEALQAPFAQDMSELLGNRSIRAAVILPFYFDDNDSLLSASSNPSDIYKNSRLALDFYAGLRMAADTLRAHGLNIRFDVYDSRNSTFTLRQIAQKIRTSQPDIVIGPLFSKNAEFLAGELPEQWIVSPLSRTIDTEKRSHLIGAVSTMGNEIIELSRWVNRRAADANIVMVYRDNEEQRNNVRLFTQHLEASDVRSIQHIKVDETYLTAALIRNMLAAGKKDVLVILDDDPVVLTSFVNSVSAAKDTGVSVLSTSRMLNVPTLEVNKLNKLNLYLSDVEYVDYSDPHTIDFILKFRREMNTDPPRFAYHGYDAGVYFLYLFSLIDDQNSRFWPEYTGITKIHRLLPYGGHGPVNAGTYIIHLENYDWKRTR